MSAETVAALDGVHVDGGESMTLSSRRAAAVSLALECLPKCVELKTEQDRLQVQLASTRDAFGKATQESADKLEQVDAAMAAVEEIKEKLDQAKVLADSRNRIIKSKKEVIRGLMQIIEEVGF